jgi:hypothetical protein
MAWTDEAKAAVIQEYVDANPTPENSMEVVKEIAEAHDQSPNGVRMILTKAGVYVKKTASTPAEGEKPASTRVSKQGAQEALTAAIVAAGKTADEDIISKMTGKAAQYFTSLLSEEG